MKVLFNTYPMAFDTPGGGERQLMAYFRHLPAFGISPTLFNLWEPCIRDHDLLHFFSVIPGSVYFFHHVRNLGLPAVVSPNLWVTPATRDQYPTEHIQPHLRMANRIIVNSDMEGDALSAVYEVPRERFTTVHNGVEEEFFGSAEPEEFRERFAVQGPYVLNVANIEPRKNQLLFLRAMKRFPDLKLVIAGHVRDRAYADQCIAEGSSQLKHVGPLPYNSPLLRSAIAGCTLFAMPSTLETPSIAALEAAAMGARILVTEVGSTREYFRELVEYLDPQSVDSMAAGVGKTLASGAPSTLRRMIRDRFSWPRVLPPLIEAYRAAIG